MNPIRAVIRRHVLAAVLLTSFASAAAAHPASSVVGTPAVHIENFGKVNQVYYRGAAPGASGVQELAALGVKTVIDLTSDDTAESEQALVEEAGMRYVNIPMTTRQNPTGDELAAFLAVVNDPAQQPVYVHCVGGRHRTGVMTAVYRMTADGWTGAKAFDEMKQYKFGADFLHPEFKKFVLTYKAPSAPRALDEAVATVAATGIE